MDRSGQAQLHRPRRRDAPRDPPRLEAAPYLAAIRDWAANGERSAYALSEAELRDRLAPKDPEHALADAEFALGEYLYKTGRRALAIPHFKEAQRLYPESWNYKRQAWALSDALRDYGTTFRDEVRKLDGKPYYAPRQLQAKKTDAGKHDDRN